MQKFVCTVHYRDDYEGANGPTWDDGEETFSSPTYDGLMDLLAEHRYENDTFNIDHNQTPVDRTYHYGPVMIIFSETPLDIADLRKTSYYEKFKEAVDKRKKKGSDWISDKVLEQMSTK